MSKVKVGEFHGFVLGWHEDKEDKRDLLRASVSPQLAAKLPAVHTLRPRMPPIWNQGSQGSCTGFMFARLVDSNRREQKLITEPPSMSFNYALSRFEQGSFPEDSGATIRGAIKAGNKYGYVLLTDFGYDDDVCDRFPDARLLAKAAQNKITVYQRVPMTEDDVRATLLKDPYGFGFPVFPNFKPNDEGIIPAVPKGKQQGGHAVTAIGYDHKRALIEIDNSWGLRFGLKGRFWMPYEFFFKYARDAWVISMVPTADRKQLADKMLRGHGRTPA